MSYLFVALAAAVVLLAVGRLLAPVCPCCHGRDWDRKLCHPMLLCRRCAMRVLPTRRLFI